MESDSAVVTLVGSLFHHWGAESEMSRNFAEQALFALSDGGTSQPADVDEGSVLTDQFLEVDRCSSFDGLEGHHHHLELDAGWKRKPVEVTEEGGHMGEDCKWGAV